MIKEIALTLAITLFSAPLDAPITVVLREKYGPVMVIDSVNAVIDKDGAYWITRSGEFYGQFPKENYSIHKQENKPHLK